MPAIQRCAIDKAVRSLNDGFGIVAIIDGSDEGVQYRVAAAVSGYLEENTTGRGATRGGCSIEHPISALDQVGQWFLAVRRIGEGVQDRVVISVRLHFEHDAGIV